MWDLQGDELSHLFGYKTTEKKVEPAEEYKEFLDNFVELYAARLEDQEGPIPAVHQHAAATKDPSWVVPNPVVVVVNIEGQPAQALIDLESLCDFMSSTLVDQLKLNRNELTTPLNMQLAVQGLCSKINYNVVCDFEYQTISAWKSSLKTAKKLRPNWTQTAQDQKFPGLSKTATVVWSSVSQDF